jgi:hypothetical protein
MSQNSSSHKISTSEAASLVGGHLLHEPDLPIRRCFYCMGFPVDLATNSSAVVAAAIESWPNDEPLFEVEPISIYITVLQTAASRCPPAPVFRPLGHISMHVADACNFAVCDLETGLSQLCISTAAVMNRSYLRYFFLDAAALTQISLRYSVPIHAACVSFDGNGVLLCGESGAGKSLLAYACARAGWSYTADDVSYLLHEVRPQIVGNCHQFRFRTTARKMLPELRGYETTPRAAGNPSIELPTKHLPAIRCLQTAYPGFLIFLNRVNHGPTSLLPASVARARSFITQLQFGPARMLALQRQAVERLLVNTPVMELTYSKCDEAIQHLEEHLRRPQ